MFPSLGGKLQHLVRSMSTMRSHGTYATHALLMCSAVAFISWDVQKGRRQYDVFDFLEGSYADDDDYRPFWDGYREV
jgi:hypothetical protein